MFYKNLISTFALLSMLFVFSSCQHIEGLFQEDEPVETVDEAEPEEIVEPVEPEIPVWYRSDEPVWTEGDTMHVAAASVSTDSTDARDMAFRALDAFIETAFTMVMEELLDSQEILAEQDPGRIVEMLVLRGNEHEAHLPGSEKIFFYRSGETDVRFYVKRSFRKRDISEIIKNSL